MKKQQIITMILLIGIATLPFQSTFTKVAKAQPEQSIVLQCITRHDGTIYNAFENKFKELYPEVKDIQWLELSNANAWKSAIESDSYSIDLLWGGGPTIFTVLADEGLLLPFQDTDLVNNIRTNVPEQISGANMILEDSSDNILWVAAAISSFGFTVNHKNLENYGLEVPETWEDLASTEYYLGTTQHAIGMGDAPATTSNTRVYQIILQKFGWEAGWDIMTRMAGNAKIFEGGSGPTRDSVINGEQAVAMTIDFYGYQAQVQNEDCEYIIPSNESIINADPIAVASSTTNREYAEKFVNFVLSEEGQSIWLDEEINRLPIIEDAFDYAESIGKGREDLYVAYNKTLAESAIPFDEDLALAIYDIVTIYFQGSFTKATVELYNAWQAIVNAYDNQQISEEEFRSLSREISQPGISLEEAKALQLEYNENPNIYDTLVNRFKSEAVARYSAIADRVTAEAGDSDDDGSYFKKFAVEITSPSGEEAVTGIVPIKADIVEYGNWSFVYGVTEASFYIDGTLVETLTHAPWEITWDTTDYSIGPHTLKVIAKEYTGRQVQTQKSVNVGEIIELPDITITSPVANATLAGLVTIEVSVEEDPSFPVSYVIVSVTGSAGEILSENITSNYGSITVDWNTNSTDDGEYTITVTVYYQTGNVKSESIVVTVLNKTYTPTPGFDLFSLILGSMALIGYILIHRRRQRL